MYTLYIAKYLTTVSVQYVCQILYFLLVAPSVVRIIATPNSDIPSSTYDYTIVCTIHPESTADVCEVTVRSGVLRITSMYCSYGYCM